MNDTTRRILGLILGLLVGLAYGLVSQLINPLFLPGIPLYHPGLGVAASIVMSCLIGGLVGVLTAWPEEALPGVLLGSLVGALVTMIISISGNRGGTDYFLGLFVLLVMTFFPRAFVFLPLAALTRWALGVWANEFQSVSFSIGKLVLSFTIPILLACVLGYFSLYTAPERQVLLRTQQLIQAGMQVNDRDSLPEPLKKVDGFLPNAHGAYTLELSDNPDLLPVQRPISNTGEQEYAVFVRFENGFRFGCAFTPNYADPACGIY
jgi:hypothetical protein